MRYNSIIMTFSTLRARLINEITGNSDERSLKLFYLTHFGALGAILPFLSLHLYELGLSSAQIGLLSSIIMVANMGVAPLWTGLADLLGKRKQIFIFNLVSTTVVFSLLLFARNFVSIALVLFSYSAFRSALVPMVNAMTLEQLADKREEYGRIRIWGSVGYVVLVLVVGKLIDLSGTSILIYTGITVYAASAIFSSRGLRRQGHGQGRSKAVKRDFVGLLKNRRFVIFMVCSFFIALSGSPYILFFSISMRQSGNSQSIVGISWMVAVLAEIGLMVYSPWIIKRFRVEKLIVFSYLVWGLRWYLMSVAVSPLHIVAIHLLHGVTFGLYYPVAMNFLDKEVPRSLQNTGQGLYSAVSYGTGGIIGHLISGILYESLGLTVLYRVGALMPLAATLLFSVSIGLGGTLKRSGTKYQITGKGD